MDGLLPRQRTESARIDGGDAQKRGMSRFAVATILSIAVECAAVLLFGIHTGGWIVVGIWIIYLSLCTWGMVDGRMQFYCKSVCRGAPGRRQVALTFDDGPDPAATPMLL